MCNTQHPSPWSGKSSSKTRCTVGIIGESLEKVSFQVPSLMHKGFHKAAAYFMEQDQREQREGKGLYSSSAE